VQRVGVIGAGIMGAGIAQVVAAAGMEVVLIDISEAVLSKGIKEVSSGLGRLVKKNKLADSEMKAILARIKPSTDYADLSNADLVLEVVSERFELKQKILGMVHKVAKPDAIIASNTSSISITKLAAVAGEGRAANFVGMHFFNPVPVMKLVEVIKGLQTSQEAFDAVQACVGKLKGKQAVPCVDSPGFVCNRILVPMVNEAAFALFESVATPADIDRVMKLGANHPMGPLRLADMIGLDTILSVTEVLYHEFGDPKYRPCPLIRKMVDAGHLGQKTGRGFYDYTKKSKL